MSYVVIHRLPSAQEYNALRLSVSWPTYEIPLIEEGLARSLFSVCVEDPEGTLVGMGRIIGDNAIYLHIQDVIVHPACQGQGIGKLIMNELTKFTDKAGGKNTNIGLMCSKGREKFYNSFGFAVRPNEKHGAGMIKIK
jgi:GNAT superfamily N-acetyltransferase